jgi:hypothetical protein
MFAKLWYTAQVLQPPSECLRQIISAIMLYIWQGAIFRVPLSTIQRRKDDGGWGLIEVNSKCRALMITRIWLQGQRDWTMMEGWQGYWRIQGMRNNPPHIRPIPHPRIPAYLVQELAYIVPYKRGEHPRTLRRRVYWTLRGMAEVGNPPRVMRIIQLYPSADWERIWTNLHECWMTEAVKINWYIVIRTYCPLMNVYIRLTSRLTTLRPLWRTRHGPTQSNRMRKGGEYLALDQTTYSMDSAH